MNPKLEEMLKEFPISIDAASFHQAIDLGLLRTEYATVNNGKTKTAFPVKERGMFVRAYTRVSDFTILLVNEENDKVQIIKDSNYRQLNLTLSKKEGDSDGKKSKIDKKTSKES